MRFIKYILLLTLITSPAMAQENKGLNYIVTSEKNAQPPKPSAMMKTMQPRKEKTQRQEDTSEQAAQEAWETYKALAMGHHTIKKEKPIQRVKPAPRTASTKKAPTPKPADQMQAPVPGIGIAGLLQEYQNSKTKRKKMNTLVVNPPKSKDSNDSVVSEAP